jgi:hypothetical protein
MVATHDERVGLACGKELLHGSRSGTGESVAIVGFCLALVVVADGVITLARARIWVPWLRRNYAPPRWGAARIVMGCGLLLLSTSWLSAAAHGLRFDLGITGFAMVFGSLALMIRARA